MLRNIALIALALTFLLPSLLAADSFDGPESVVFDSLRSRYLVNNYYAGTITEIDSLGNTSQFLGGYSTIYANWIVNDTLYFTANQNRVIGMDLSTEQIFMTKTIAALQHLDGVTADTSGSVYALDTGGRLHRIRISDQTATLFADQGIQVNAQDIVFDKEHNRIMVCSYSNASTVVGVDITDGSVTVLVPSGASYLDGIDRDDRGNTYVASHSSWGYVFRFDSTFTKMDTISVGHDEPAGLCYNLHDRIIAIPNFESNTISYIPDPYYLDDDSDGVINGLDNCADLYNPGQEDYDADGVGDDCDICPDAYDPDQGDSDSDGFGDACDLCLGFDDSQDIDGDTVPDSCDNCPYKFNPDQADSNSDDVGDACDVECGDADASGEIDIDDIVYLIAYIFTSGPAPEPLAAGEADCSGEIDIDDAVYLIAYAFAGGSTPCDPGGDGVPDC